MGQSATRWALLLSIFAILSAGAGSTVALSTERYLAGLGLHQETGRNIYLGGVYLDPGTPRPDSLTQLAGPWTMEYRIIARRTSIRSILGGILLQSEMATGSAPDAGTTDFADAILSAVKSPLYAGDAFQIRLEPDGATSATLNGHELAQVPQSGVANYLLQGWIGEIGPSTTFRADLLASAVNPSLLATLRGNNFTTEREAEIAAWFVPLDDAATEAATEVATTGERTQGNTIATTTRDAPEPIDATPEPEPQEPEVAAASALAAAAVIAASPALQTNATDATPLAGNDSPTREEVAATPKVASAPVNEPATPQVMPEGNTNPEAPADTVRTATPPAEFVASAPMDTQSIQLASLAPMSSVIQSSSNDVLSLGVQEYSQRLSQFHGGAVAMVYKKIRYPARAVRRSLEGRVELDVTLSRAGELLAVTVAQSSGHRILDSAAVKAAEGAFSEGALQSIDPVAVAEFGDAGNTVAVPIPVSFELTE